MIGIVILFVMFVYHYQDPYIWLKSVSKFLTQMTMLKYLNAMDIFEMLIAINI